MSNLYDLGEMILYLGPLRVPLVSRWVDRGTIFAREDSWEVVGYPNFRKCTALIVYKMGKDVHPYLQSLFRNPEILEKWTGLLCIEGQTWAGSLSYHWSTNEIISRLILVS